MLVTCVIVDDNPGFIESVQRLLEAGGITVVGTCATEIEAERLVALLQPTCVLVDVELGEQDGVRVAERVSMTGAVHTAILMSGHDATDLPLPRGVAGFLSKATLDADAVLRLVRR